MLYQLRPPAELVWCDAPSTLALDDTPPAPASGLDELVWEPTHSRVFSKNMLQLALRYGVATSSGIVLDAIHATALGRADELRAEQMAIEESRARSAGERGEQLPAEWVATDAELDEVERADREVAARAAERELADALAAPVRTELAMRWLELGGQLPA